jgi:hypothetical protein
MPCLLTLVPDTTDYEGPAGRQVTVVTKDHLGSVFIAKAEYAGQALVPPGQAVSTLTFGVLPDRNTLKLVFVFSASTAGRGELREQAGGDSQFLRDIAGHEPFQIVRITGK